MLSRVQNEVILDNDIGFDNKREKLKEELKVYKAELKEKQVLLRKQERHMKEQHEIVINLEEKCRKYQALIYEHKAGTAAEQRNERKQKTEEDIARLREKLQEEENKYEEEKIRCKQLINNHENLIKDLNYELDSLTLELKQKNQIARINYLKINELKRLIRAHGRPRGELVRTERKLEVDTNLIAANVDKLKRVMMTEKNLQTNSFFQGTMSSPYQIIEEEKASTTLKESKKNFNDAVMQTIPVAEAEELPSRSSNLYPQTSLSRRKN
eukprot:TRINITY_DN3785_c0_g2_i1.p1 TRINITY_DN3785_c0_g2~~TRINITY_DN3785_c0_g2_i1.p1  ORF type:complete len:269 (-),score=99.33 TRINITY_DN3785_c0_g2_i1:40-846(-)